MSSAISDFFDDLKEHDAGDNLIMVLFTEFGRRVKDNGTGTDHGAAGAAFVIGNQVKGGMYNEYPSLRPEDLQQGDLAPNNDFRGFYSTIIDRWLGSILCLSSAGNSSRWISSRHSLVGQQQEGRTNVRPCNIPEVKLC